VVLVIRKIRNFEEFGSQIFAFSALSVGCYFA